ELPKIRHQPGMGIAGEPTRLLQFAAEMLQVFFAEASFQKSPRVHAGRRMPLVIDQVAAIAIFATAPEEMIEAHFVQGGRRSKSGDVPTQAVEMFVGPMNDRHRV